MGWESRYNDATVPILGKAFEIIQHWPTVILQCQCDAHSILTLVGPSGTAVKCQGCGNVYGVGKVGGVEVGLVRVGVKAETTDAPAESVDLDAPQGNA